MKDDLMSIIAKLSSQTGDKTEAANRRVVDECLTKPALLNEIAEQIKSGTDPALLGDCLEVTTKVAEVQPELVADYSQLIVKLIAHKNTRVRWEAWHALSLVAHLRPNVIQSIIDQLPPITHTDKSTIVRDYAIETLCNYASVGKVKADEAYPILLSLLDYWDDKHAARVLRGLANAASNSPGHKEEVAGLAAKWSNSPRASIQKSAKQVLKQLG